MIVIMERMGMTLGSRFVAILCLTASLTAPMFAQSWTRQNIQRKDTVFYGMSFPDKQHGFVVGTDGVMFRTTDAGTTWVNQDLGTTMKLTAVSFVTPSVGFIVGELGTILKTTDGGDHWSPLDAKTKATFFTVHFFDEDSGFVAGQGGALLYTNDKGANWVSKDAKFDANNIYGLSFPTKKIGYACGNAGNVSKTTNGGITWQSQNSGFKFSILAISFGNANIGTIVGDGGVIRHTTNGGRNWVEQLATVPLTSYPLYAVQHVDSTRAYIAGWIGMILYKDEKDPYWTALDNGYADPLNCIHFFNQKEGYVGGWNCTVLKTTNGGGATVGIERPSESRSLLLQQNAPNPIRLSTSTTTQIRFEIAQAGHASVKVYNAMGKEVGTIVDEQLAPGRYMRNWTIPALPAGAYYSVLRSGSSAVSRTLTIVR
jgi:photosystem II stability/assembly factor-like uncharacterized protein